MTSRRPSTAEAGTFYVASILVGNGAWVLSHHVGLHGEISLNHLFMIWVASLSALMATLFIGRTSDGEDYFTISGTVVLLLPSFWFAVEFFFYDSTDTFSSTIRWIAAILVVLIALPYIIYLLLICALPDVSELRHPRLWIGLVTIAILIGIIGYVVGAYSSWFGIEDLEGAAEQFE